MKRILIVRPDAIGDFIIFSAVLEEYEKLYQGYKIDLLCWPRVKELTQHIPFINKVIFINTPKLFRKRYPLYTYFTLLRLKMMRYEKVIYPVYSRFKNDDLIVKTIRAKEKIVYDGDSARDPKNERYVRNKYFTKIIESEKEEKPEMDRNREFINKLGAHTDKNGIKPKIWFSDNDEIEFEKLKQLYKLEENRYICIFPGAGGPNKYWRSEKWTELIKRLINEYQRYKVVMLGNGNDRVDIEGVMELLDARVKEKVVNLYNKTSLRALAKVIQHAKLLIGMDTGAIHIAAAVGTPNICLMGGGHFNRFYPYGDLSKNRIVFHKMDCYGCNWKCKYEAPKCIHEIKVGEVWREIECMLI